MPFPISCVNGGIYMKKMVISTFIISLVAVLALFSIAQTNDTDINATVNATANVTTNQTTTNQTNQSNQTNQTNVTTTMQANVTPSVNMYIMKWFPKGPDYVFACNASGFEPARFTWFYGDGHKLLNILNQNTYHVYQSTGTFTVSCTATDGNLSASDTMAVTVTNLTRPLRPLFSDDRNYRCVNAGTNRNATCTCENQN